MKIVATNDYLVLVTKDDITGFVINSETHETYPEMSIAAILNHGDWDFVKDGENEDQVQKAEPNPQLDMTYAKPGRHEVEQLKRENDELKHLVGDLSLELHRLKKTEVPPLGRLAADGT